MEEFETGPFGNTEGRRHASDLFVRFDDSKYWGGIATSDNDLKARVFIGRKGSGKTVYLKRLHVFLKSKENASEVTEKEYTQDEFHSTVPRTDAIISFCKQYDLNELGQNWQDLWRICILRALCSHILHVHNLRSKLSDQELSLLENDFSKILDGGLTPRTILQEASRLLHQHPTRTDIRKLFGSPLWIDLENLASIILKKMPPICFFVDAIDEEYKKAPMYWLQCQKALYYTVMNFLNHTGALGGRLHIFICIREHVFASIMKSEHATRHLEEQYSRHLIWNKESAEYFLLKKVENIPETFFEIKTRKYTNPIHNWLGMNEIHNIKCGVKEPVLQYILRHTRLLPRDIIGLGNALFKELYKRSKGSEEYDSLESLIRQVVSNRASVFGNEQLRICANHLLSNMLPGRLKNERYTEFTGGNESMVDSAYQAIVSFIEYIGVNRFRYDKLLDAQQHILKSFGIDDNISSILWLNGLLGFVDSDRKFNFFSEDFKQRFDLVENRNYEYVFHTILLDSTKVAYVGSPIIQ